MLSALVKAYHNLQEQGASWRDQHGRPYGMGPDCRRKALAIRTLVEAFGYRVDHAGGYYFDVALATTLEIPEACWPDNARNAEEE